MHFICTLKQEISCFVFLQYEILCTPIEMSTCALCFLFWEFRKHAHLSLMCFYTGASNALFKTSCNADRNDSFPVINAKTSLLSYGSLIVGSLIVDFHKSTMKYHGCDIYGLISQP